ncbi:MULTISPECIES: hypothetical protein [Streptomyces]|uniref:hypothetical protein n=1 Tax=Streptomyces TaxID=1883 RepID=UPI000A3FF202|nr:MULTISPECIES: hypothetical protein [Streptomyces]MDI5908006.1 hypothetical protein [Streptomyces sp. 12257]
MRWQAITERAIRIDHRTYDHDVIAPSAASPRPSPRAAAHVGFLVERAAMNELALS